MNEHSDILVVDDEKQALMACRLALLSGGLGPVTACEDPREALRLIQKKEFALALLDLSMPGISGEELLEQIRQKHPEMPVVILTAFSDAETAMRCVRAGAHDYLIKPIDKDRLLTTVRRVLETRALRNENVRLKNHLLGRQGVEDLAFQSMLTRDEGMRAVFHYAKAIAESSEPVLITGETGTGKDLMARAIHTLSGRKGAFVALNVAGLDEQLFNDVLFGHSKGAFTSAVQSREGLLQKAKGGTIFLDEMGDLELSLQSKLLRVIESGEYYAAGSDQLLRSDARVMVATNRDVEELCTSGKMRRDLFYRLDVHHIHLPSLRERGNDVLLLARAFADAAAESLKRPPLPFGGDVEAVLTGYSWPGNVRELKAVMTDAVSRTPSGGLSVDVLNHKLLSGKKIQRVLSRAQTRIPTLREAAENLIQMAMQQAGGNQRLAAQMLGISQPALSKRLKKEKGDADDGE